MSLVVNRFPLLLQRPRASVLRAHCICTRLRKSTVPTSNFLFAEREGTEVFLIENRLVVRGKSWTADSSIDGHRRLPDESIATAYDSRPCQDRRLAMAAACSSSPPARSRLHPPPPVHPAAPCRFLFTHPLHPSTGADPTMHRWKPLWQTTRHRFYIYAPSANTAWVPVDGLEPCGQTVPAFAATSAYEHSTRMLHLHRTRLRISTVPTSNLLFAEREGTEVFSTPARSCTFRAAVRRRVPGFFSGARLRAQASAILEALFARTARSRVRRLQS